MHKLSSFLCRRAVSQPLFRRLVPWIHLQCTPKATLAYSGPKNPPRNKPTTDGPNHRAASRPKRERSPQNVFEQRIRDSKENWKTALSLLQEMKATEHGASLAAYNAAINACARGKQSILE